MRSVEFVGYLACTLVFATLCVKAMMALRLIAIASNIAFMSYGYLGEIVPILLLHIGLLPLNAWRLFETLRSVSGSRHAMSRAGLSVKLLRQRRKVQRDVLRNADCPCEGALIEPRLRCRGCGS